MITIESVFSKSNINRAFNHLSVKKNGGGSDKDPLEELRNYWELNKDEIKNEIFQKKFSPDIVKEYEIVNGKGKRRTVSQFSEIDKFITRLLSQKLQDFYSPRFLANSFAYQDGKGILTAVEKAKEFIEAKNEFVVEIDMQNYFDEVPLDRILELIAVETKDDRVLNLIDVYLHCKIARDDTLITKEKGLVQGSSMSPILSNLYLHSLDLYMEEQKYNWIRFADDIRIFVASEEIGMQIMADVKRFLTEDLALVVNDNKSGVYDVFDRRMLGYDFRRKNKQIKIEKHSYNKKEYFNNWHESSVEKINKEYHIVRDGVLNKKDYALLFENEENKFHIPVETTEQINIYNEVTITSSVMRTFEYENIRMALYDKYGDLVGYFVPESFYKDSKTILEQCLEYSDERRRMAMAKKMEIAAIHNIRANIRYYNKKIGSLDETISELTSGITQMNECKSVDELLLIEGRCRQKYYQSFNVILDNSDFEYTTRSRRPPKDPINALISFGNTLLYNRIQQIIWKTTLDSRIGIFHAANKRHYSLNLDFADLFKPIIVDRVIFKLINRKQLTANDFTKLEDGAVYLNNDGKKKYIEEFLNKLNSKLEIEGKSISYQQLLEKEVAAYRRHITDGEEYKPYKYY